MSREQLASLLARALGLPVVTSDAYVDDAGSMHEGAINSVTAVGVMSGCDAKRFCPSAPATRDVLRVALQNAQTSPEDGVFAPTADLAKAPPICPTARYCQKQALTRTYVAAALGAFLRNGPMPIPDTDGAYAEDDSISDRQWWTPPI